MGRRIKVWNTIVLNAVLLVTAACSVGAAEREPYRVEIKKYAAGSYATYECPVVTGVGVYDQAALDLVNEQLYDTAEHELLYYAEMIDQSQKELMEFNPDVVSHLTYESVCDSIYLEDDLFSVRMLSYSYMGGAHGYSCPYGYSFDLRTGELLSLESLLDFSEQQVKSAVLEAYRQEIIGRVPEVTEGAVLEALEEMEYWVEEDGIHLNFAPYLVASYAAGQQEAVITPEIAARVKEGKVLQADEVSMYEEMISVIAGIQAPASDFVLPQSSVRALTWDDLTVLDGATVEEDHYWSQLAINEILARYGYVFNPEQGGSALEAYNQFEGRDWYEAAKPYCPSTSANEMLYTYITATELSNIDLICEWQKEHGCYY